MQGQFAARPVARQPLVGRALRNAGSQGSLRYRPAIAVYPLDKKGSTTNRHAGILVDVHPGLHEKTVWLRNHSLTPKSRVNNLHSNDS